VNDLLNAQPELLNKDPYGEGWICEITFEGEPPKMLDAGAYKALVG